jgi:Flp pilus assembly protein TadG
MLFGPVPSGAMVMAGSATKFFGRGAARLFRSKTLARFVRHQDGSTVVEFGAVIAPFLGLLFAIIETSIVFFAGQTLETATADSARLIMTGQQQSSNAGKTAADSLADFKSKLCNINPDPNSPNPPLLKALFDCSKLIIDVRNYTTFSSADFSKPIDNNGNLINNAQYSPGGPGAIVVVRVMYPWPLWVSGLGFNLADMSGGNRLLVATATFRNEPY